MSDPLALVRRDPVLAAAAAVATVGLLTMCGFFFFEYVLGYPPCPLCLDQRNAYYVSVPLAALLWLGAGHGASNKVMIAGFAVITAVMLWNTGLAAYHAGVEWKFWPGPSECTGFGYVPGQEDFKPLQIVRCDEAQWRLFGLSLAGYNAIFSFVAAAIAALVLRGPALRDR